MSVSGFKGTHYHTIDAKGRLIIPAKLRDGLGESFVLTKGPDACLIAFPTEEWEEMEQKMRANLAFSKSDSRAFVRNFFASASDCEPDNLGRILVEGHLREYADLMGKNEVVIIGIANRVEIWNKALWTAYCDDNSDMMNISTGMEHFDI